jgi:UDP-N-acetylmuramoylalanine--D-glutamate ligase
VIEVEGRRVIVVGLGASGLAAARALLRVGATLEVTENDHSPVLEQRAAELRRSGAHVTIGGHDTAGLDADFAVVSPGIPPQAPIIKALMHADIPLWSEIELAYRLARCEFLAVTGTNGKTTTTALLAAMLAAGGIPSTAAGNIGLPLVEAVQIVGDDGAIAVELSSFQLANIKEFRPRAAVLLNVAEDHTDWHGSFEAYLAAKARIVENQTSEDNFLPNHEDPAAMEIASSASSRVLAWSAVSLPAGGVGVADERVLHGDVQLFRTSDVPLAGEAGLQDAIAAAAAAVSYGVDPRAIRETLRDFRPPSHRLETVATVDGVSYIDDSKATNPHATITAVRGLQEVVLIAGGRSKGIDLSPLVSAVPPVTAVVALGESREEVAAVFDHLVPVELAEDMEDAVARARRLANGKGSVLLSPACASLDMYASYAERGACFASAVRALLDGRQKDDLHG